MATPGELVAAVAEALGIPLATVVEHDRNLVVAGLRTKGGRGRSAPQTTPRDLAHLLAAILGSELIQHSVHSVRRYEVTVPAVSQSSPQLFAGSGIEELESLPKRHSFLDALEALAAAMTGGSVAAGTGSKAPATGMSSVEIGVLSPGTLADIRLAGLTRRDVRSVRYLLPDPFDGEHAPGTAELKAWEARIKQLRVDSYVKVYRSLDEEALFRLATRLRVKGGRMAAGPSSALARPRADRSILKGRR
ncbi:MAG: hypothetical protein KIS73_17760 [Enhydrobacter sp.]|nr:hypothetical protein [Enhydrobacter sp.]